MVAPYGESPTGKYQRRLKETGQHATALDRPSNTTAVASSRILSPLDGHHIALSY
jgi:hypothetical protein